MLHSPRPITEEYRANDIESGNDVIYRGLVGAINYKTRENLKQLGSEYKDAQITSIVEQAKQAENIILARFAQVLPNLGGVNRAIAVEINLDMKEKMQDVLPAIQYLYNQRYGDIPGGSLNVLLNSDKDEPYMLLFVFAKDSGGKFYLEKLLLEEKNKREYR